MISDAEYLAHPKVEEARKLLREAWFEIRDEKERAYASSICTCTHRRDQHGPAHSINYTGGVCGEKGCKCLNFLQRKATE